MLNEVQDARAAMIAHVIYKMNADKKSPKLDLSDFMPDRSKRKRKKEKPQSPEEMAATALDIALAFGGRIVKE